MAPAPRVSPSADKRHYVRLRTGGPGIRPGGPPLPVSLGRVEQIPGTDAEVAVAAAEAGAAVVRARYGGPLDRFAKSPTDFATDADLESERTIRRVLATARPADGVVGEELGGTDALAADRVWLVDPLCGTSNFAARTPLFAVNVVLREGGGIVAAASVDPIGHEVFWTDGRAAWSRRDGVDERLAPSAGTGLVDLNLDGPYPNDEWFSAVGFLAGPAFAGILRPRVSATTLAVAWVAVGRRAAFVSDGDMRDNVHFSAGIALCRAAGCVVGDLSGRELASDREGGLVVAADEATHASVLAGVKESR